MRILHVVHDYLPEQVAGVEVYTNRIATRQARRSDVGILFARLDPTRATGRVDRRDEAGVRLYAVVQNRDWTRFEQTWSDPRVEGAIDDALDDFAPDVMHVQHLMHLGLAPVDRARRRGLPVVMTLHDQWLACAAGGQRFHPDRTRCDVLDAGRCGRCTAGQVGLALWARGAFQRHAGHEDVGGGGHALPGWLSGTKALGRAVWRAGAGLGGRRRIEARWRVMRALADRVDLFVVPSRDLLEQAAAFGLPRARLHHLPHGLPRRTGPSRPLPETARRFGIVGSLVPHKGLHVAIEAFTEMPADATLEIVGALDDDPRYVDELRRLARHPGVRFVGECPPERVPQELDALDVLVAPSIWRENAPLGVQEALAAGRPVIATRLGGHVELLADGGGLLVAPDAPRALAEAMRRCAAESGLIATLAGSAPRIPGLDEHVDALEEIYARVSQGRSAALPRAVLLDRDGVVNFDRADYVRRLEDWRPIPGSVEAIARLSRAGVRVAVVTNQSGVGRGLIPREELERIHARLSERVAGLGGAIDQILYCPHTPDDRCDCRKPAPGLIERGCRLLDVPAADAVVVGDRVSDLEAARRTGCRGVFVRSGATREAALGDEWDDVPRFDDLESVVDGLLRPIEEGA